MSLSILKKPSNLITSASNTSTTALTKRASPKKNVSFASNDTLSEFTTDSSNNSLTKKGYESNELNGGDDSFYPRFEIVTIPVRPLSENLSYDYDDNQACMMDFAKKYSYKLSGISQSESYNVFTDFSSIYLIEYYIKNPDVEKKGLLYVGYSNRRLSEELSTFIDKNKGVNFISLNNCELESFIIRVGIDAIENGVAFDKTIIRSEYVKLLDSFSETTKKYFNITDKKQLQKIKVEVAKGSKNFVEPRKNSVTF
jgi:hypothetical protein